MCQDFTAIDFSPWRYKNNIFFQRKIWRSNTRSKDTERGVSKVLFGPYNWTSPRHEEVCAACFSRCLSQHEAEEDVRKLKRKTE